MKLFRYLLLIFILSFSLLPAFCQDGAGKNIVQMVERLRVFGQRIPQEKVFVHMDNTCYFQGDTIWFSAYTRQTNTGMPSQMSGVLYVELLNSEGYLQERKLIEMRQGRGDGFFSLNYPVQYSGFYELRAYTRWQLNWGVYEHRHSRLSREWFLSRGLEKEYYRDYEKLYSRVFPVYDRSDYPENPERIMTPRQMRRQFKDEAGPDARKQKLTLFPEGGELLENVPCRVAFEASWDDGEWLSGTLQVDGQTVEAAHRGRGVFTLTPRSGKEPEAVFTCKDGSVIRQKLPKARKTGASLCVTREGEVWRIGVKLSPDLSPECVGLTLMREGNLCHFRNLTQAEHTFDFPMEELKEGVNQATVFDEKGQVLADRLFFVSTSHTARPSLSLKTDKESYGPYEKIALSIEGGKEQVPISVAVRDGQQADNLYDNGSILTEMLLSSEVRGFIPQPGWYFEADDDLHRQALDLLMMTQGWRRFEWRDMAVQGAWDLTQPLEKAPIIKGSVFDFDVQNMMEQQKEVQAEIKAEEQKSLPQETLDMSGNKEVAERGNDNSVAADVQGAGMQRYDQKNYRKYLKQEYGVRSNLKREVKVHVELVKMGEGASALMQSEAETSKGMFRVQLPRFYGNCVLFLSAADTTKWKEGEKYTWVQALGEEDFLPGKSPLKYRVESADYFVRVDQPYPNFVKKYNFYQQRAEAPDYTFPDKNVAVGESVTTMDEVEVKEKQRNRLQGFNDFQPAVLMDAYEARNRQYDAGMFFAPTVRTFVQDYGLETPYVRSSGGAYDEQLYELYGIDRLTRVEEGLDVPEDSMYHRKNLRVYRRGYDLGRQLSYFSYMKQPKSGNEDFGIFKYGIYTDYSPRLEGSKRYQGANLPETYLAKFPSPDESPRVLYRDRRYVFQGFSYPADFYSPDYSRQTPPDDAKDYRRTLYWNANLLLDAEGKANVTLYNNARETRVRVDAAGQAADGTLLWGEE